jgi:DinB superfamily
MPTIASTNIECSRIADQLRRAFAGDAWHGSSLRDLLSDVTHEQAHAKPLAAAHSIWELTLHIGVWAKTALASMRGVPMPAFVEDMPPEQNWPLISDTGASAWKTTQENTLRAGSELAALIEGFGDERLAETVPGRDYGFYNLFHGIVQHSLYHAGQIAILKKAPPPRAS